MAELAFTKQFLGLLNSRSLKLNPDHAEDPKNYTRPPLTLPKPPYVVSPGKKPRLEESPSVAIQFKTLRPPHISFTTPPLHIQTTTILTCKYLLSQHTAIPIDKLKLLHKVKVLGDVVFLREVFGDQGVPAGGVGVLNVMFMGGAVPQEGSGVAGGVEVLGGDKMEVDKEATSVSGAEVGKKEGEGSMLQMDVDQQKVGLLEREEFWSDLKGWLVPKLEGEGVSPEELIWLFREAWKGKH